MSTVFVTGASGHIGPILVRKLLERGDTVRALIYAGDETGIADLPIEKIPGDLFDNEALKKGMAGADVVYHLAARISIVGPEGGLVHKINVEGVRNVARIALESGVKRFVHFSSIHAFKQEPKDVPFDETRTLCDASNYAYDYSKAQGIGVIREFVEKGLHAVIVNPGGVIGPMDWHPSRMGHVWLDLYHGKLPGVVDGGFTWVDARDVVDGAMAAETKGRPGECYLLTGEYHKVIDLVHMAEKVTGKRMTHMETPMWLARLVAPFALWFALLFKMTPLFTPESLGALRGHPDVRHDKATNELGFAPRPVAESIKDIYAWFKEQNML
ncbi:NAD-dependent epimerase/dehydratase family protein [bacterium]|nr:NAD-dependent epimerase/dehydratase family protein [bacterium]